MHVDGSPDIPCQCVVVGMALFKLLLVVLHICEIYLDVLCSPWTDYPTCLIPLGWTGHPKQDQGWSLGLLYGSWLKQHVISYGRFSCLYRESIVGNDHPEPLTFWGRWFKISWWFALSLVFQDLPKANNVVNPIIDPFRVDIPPISGFILGDWWLIQLKLSATGPPSATKAAPKAKAAPAEASWRAWSPAPGLHWKWWLVGSGGWVVSIWVNYNDLTSRPSPGIMVNKGNHPQMAQQFRLVNYYNLPRSILFF